MMKNVVISDNKPEKPIGCRFHSIETHNFHIKRYGKCLYCNAGSVAVPKVIIEEESD